MTSPWQHVVDGIALAIAAAGPDGRERASLLRCHRKASALAGADHRQVTAHPMETARHALVTAAEFEPTDGLRLACLEMARSLPERDHVIVDLPPPLPHNVVPLRPVPVA